MSDEWKNVMVESSQKMSATIEEAFHVSVTAAMSELKEKTHANVQEILECNLDYLFGTAVAVSTQYINDGEDFEDMMLHAIMDKFTLLRKIKADREAAQAKAEVDGHSPTPQ